MTKTQTSVTHAVSLLSTHWPFFFSNWSCHYHAAQQACLPNDQATWKWGYWALCGLRWWWSLQCSLAQWPSALASWYRRSSWRGTLRLVCSCTVLEPAEESSVLTQNRRGGNIIHMKPDTILAQTLQVRFQYGDWCWSGWWKYSKKKHNDNDDETRRVTLPQVCFTCTWSPRTYCIRLVVRCDQDVRLFGPVKAPLQLIWHLITGSLEERNGTDSVRIHVILNVLYHTTRRILS